MATFEIQYHDGRTERREVPAGTFLVGREQGDFVLGDPRVSGTHGELQVRGASVTYVDRGSSNGSFDDKGERLQGPVELAVGSVLCLGSSRITLIATSADGPGAPRARAFPGGTMVMGSALGAQGVPPAVAVPAPPAPGPAPQQAQPEPVLGSAPAAPVSAPPPAQPPSPSAQPAHQELGVSPSVQPAQSPPAQPPSPSAQLAGSELGVSPSVQPAQPPPATNVWDYEETEPERSPFVLHVDQPFGIPVTAQAGSGMTGFVDELKQRIGYIWKLYEPHLKPLMKLVGFVAVPLAVLQFLLGVVPLLGALLGALLVPIASAILMFYILGGVNQYVHVLRQGAQPNISQALSAHQAVLVPWIISLASASIPSILAFLCMVTIILAPIGFLLLIPAIMLTWGLGPAFVIEGRRGLDAPMRSYRVLRADFRHTLQGLAILLIASFPLVVGSMVIGAIPGVRLLSPFVSAAIQMFMMPFSALYTFALFEETKIRLSNAGRDVP